jgi:hypothetical protein
MRVVPTTQLADLCNDVRRCDVMITALACWPEVVKG